MEMRSTTREATLQSSAAGHPLLDFILLAALAVLLSGCGHTMQALKTPISVPGQFSEAESVSDPGQSSEAAREPLPDKWWLSFEDNELNRLIEQALANNFSLKSAWDRLNQAQALARSAGAERFPTLDADAGYSQSRYRQDSVTDDYQTYSLGLTASYEVDLWGRVSASRDAGAFEARASAEDLRTAAVTLSAQVADTWYQLVEQYGQLDMLVAQLDTNEKILELVTAQVRTGQVGISDMLQQRQLVESNRGEQTQVAAQAEVLEHQLAILLGATPDQSVTRRVAAFADLPSMPNTGLPADLIRRRPDIRSAYYSVQAADSDLATAIANRFPRLSLSATVDASDEHIRDLFDNWLATIAANLVAPVIDGGARKAEVERTRAAASEALHTYGQTILDALGEVEDALVQERSQATYIESLDKQLALAGQVVERVRGRYLQGTVDYQRVLDALLSEQTLQRSLITARLSLVQDRIDLCRALCGGWQLMPSVENQADVETAVTKDTPRPDEGITG